MKNRKWTVLFVFLNLMFASCTPYISTPSKGLEPDFQKQKTQNDLQIKQIQSALTTGGQPGLIKASGALVIDDSKTDSRVTIQVKTGVSQDGSQPQLINKFKPKLNSAIEPKFDMTKLSQLKTLISIGCNDKVALFFANQNGLEVQTIAELNEKTESPLQASLILMCKNIDSSKAPNISLVADQIIFSNLDLKLTGMVGQISIIANKLSLLGSNSIKSKGLDSDMVVTLAPSIDINIINEISSDKTGNLIILSTGASYLMDSSGK